MSSSIKNLYYEILEFEDQNIFDSVLKPWVEKNEYKEYIYNILSKFQLNQTYMSQEDNWELYAVTRVLDILTLQFQPNNNADGSTWIGSRLSISEYIEFVKIIGLEITTPNTFNTFDCEIIEAQAGDNDFYITESLFPAVKLQNLMIKRAGVKILLNPHSYNLTLINNASIYWAFRRKNRKYLDLSQGWGSNSQWKTDLRLDIESNHSFVYNEKGKFNLNNVTTEVKNVLRQENLEIQEAIELIKYRHFIKSTKDDSDLFPYDFRYEEIKNQELKI